MGAARRRSKDSNLLFSFENFVLDTDHRELRRDGEVILLQPQVFDLLTYVIRHRDRVVSKDDLIEAVWGGRIVSESTLASRINAVRAAIGDTGEAQRLLRTLPRRGVRFVGSISQPASADTVPATAVSPGVQHRPAIAVLPFANMSGDADQEYFADGITEDIITALSKWRWFDVIARNSSFAYKGRNVDARQIGRELGVHYVLEGSIRKAVNRVRVTAQLIDASNGAHIWAERYDRELSDVFAIQDDVSQHVGAAIEPALSKREIERSRRKTPEQMVAYDHLLRGIWHFHKFNPGDAGQAVASFNKAIELDPTLADAYANLARTMLSTVMYGFSLGPGASLDPLESAKQALDLDPENPIACYVTALVLAHRDDADAAVTFAKRAIELNDSYTPAFFALAVINTFLGQTEEALAAIDRALRLSPADPQRFVWLAQRASALYLSKRYIEAADTARQSLRMRWYHTACRVLAASLAQLGEIEAAIAAASELVEHTHADKTIRDVIRPFKQRADRDHYAEGLRKACMPE
jgi:adenylate cyclase